MITLNRENGAVDQRWSIRFQMPASCGEIFHIDLDGKETAYAKAECGTLKVGVTYDFKPDIPLCLEAKAEAGADVLLNCRGYVIELTVNGEICDEEWPYGCVMFDGAELVGDAAFKAECEGFGVIEPEVVGTIDGDMEGWRPSENVFVGDCMPYFDSKKNRYRVFYLKDRHHHQSKWKKGAHQWSQISTVDYKNWQKWDVHPLAVGVTEMWEGSICTGSVCEHNGVYYAYYAVRSTDGSPAKLTYATSTDCCHFTKSGKTFEIESCYNQESARDPKVYKGTDGKFYMLITTSVMEEGEYRGCLVRYKSDDMLNWEHDKTIVELKHFKTWEEVLEPECSDFFHAGDYWYLIYSVGGTAHYCSAKTQDGPWREFTPENFDTFEFVRVPKAGVMSDGRIVFCGWKPANGFGGTMHFYEADATEEGGLRLKALEK